MAAPALKDEGPVGQDPPDGEVTQIETVPLATQAYGAVRALILSGELAPGATIVDGHLSARLGVSRTPVREATKRLQQEGLLVQLPNRRTIVAELPISELLNLYIVRASVEGAAAFLASRNPERMHALAAAQTSLARALGTGTRPSPSDWNAINTSVHDGIAAASGSSLIATTLEILRTKVRLCRAQVLKRPRNTAATLREHRGIVQAVIDGKPEQAARLMQQHILRAGERTLLRAERPDLAGTLRSFRATLGGQSE